MGITELWKPSPMENYYSICKYSPQSQQANSLSPNSFEDDDASLFDIDLTLPTYCDAPLFTDEEYYSEEEFEFNFSISSSSQTSPNQCISPAEDNLFYQGQMLPLQVHPTKDMVRKLGVHDGKGSLQSRNFNGIKIQLPTLLKTAAKLKISLFGQKKSTKAGMDLQASYGKYGSVMDSAVQKQNKFFTLKFKVVDVPLVSLFTRDNSRGLKRDDGFQKKSEESDGDIGQYKSNDRDKKRGKEIVQKYVKMIKPLYVKISQRYNERTRHADLGKNGIGARSRSQNQLSFSGNLKMVYKHFVKRKNSSSNVNSSLPNYNNESTTMELQRAIQGAIAHCKQSNYTDGAPDSSKNEFSP